MENAASRPLNTAPSTPSVPPPPAEVPAEIDVLRLLLPQLVELDALARAHRLDGIARHTSRAVDWADRVLTGPAT